MLHNNVYVKDTPEKGKSLFAGRDFKKDETIFVISGPIVKRPTIFTVPIDIGLYIDPEPFDNDVKYLCHSCEPNCGIKNRTQVVGMGDIRKDEEITIDYAMIVHNYTLPEPAEIICKCGSKKCRGELGCFVRLPDEVKRKYEGFISDYLLGDKS